MEEQTGMGGPPRDVPPLHPEHDEEPEAPVAGAAASPDLIADALEHGKQLLSEHKGKLAIGVAATLGLMVYYKWRDKKLARDDPEEYARLQRIKAGVRNGRAESAPPDDEQA